VKNASLGAVLSDKTMWQLIALNFFYQTGIYGYTLWLPTILKELTHSSMGQVGMLAILPYVGAIAGMFLFSSLSDRTGKRKLFVCLPLIGFALHVPLRGAEKSNLAGLCRAGRLRLLPAIGGWRVLDHPGTSVQRGNGGGARGVINALGNLGGFCGPYAVGVLITLYSKDAGVYCLAISGAGRADGAAAAGEMRCRCCAGKDDKSHKRTAYSTRGAAYGLQYAGSTRQE
jgi:MFS family permease